MRLEFNENEAKCFIQLFNAVEQSIKFQDAKVCSVKTFVEENQKHLETTENKSEILPMVSLEFIEATNGMALEFNMEQLFNNDIANYAIKGINRFVSDVKFVLKMEEFAKPKEKSKDEKGLLDKVKFWK